MIATRSLRHLALVSTSSSSSAQVLASNRSSYVTTPSSLFSGGSSGSTLSQFDGLPGNSICGTSPSLASVAGQGFNNSSPCYVPIFNLQRRTMSSNSGNYLIDEPKYAFLKQLGIEKDNAGVFNGQWFGSGEVICFALLEIVVNGWQFYATIAVPSTLL